MRSKWNRSSTRLSHSSPDPSTPTAFLASGTEADGHQGNGPRSSAGDTAFSWSLSQPSRRAFVESEPTTDRNARPSLRKPSAVRDRPPARARLAAPSTDGRSEEHTSELQSLMRTSYAVFCLK